MLAKSTIRRFRNRKLNSYDFMKRLSRRQLLRMIDELEPKPDFISPFPMWRHQLATFLISLHVKQFLPYLDMGTGKSRIILELIAYLKKCESLKCAIIVAPNDTSVENWVMELEEHRPDLGYAALYGSSEEKLDALDDLEGIDVCIVSYPGLNWMCCDLSKNREAKQKLVINRKKIQFVSSKFNFMCLDECTEIMSHSSLQYRVCRKISATYEYRFGMAGIPIGRNPEAFWSQFEYCDHGETLGETLGLFRAAFFKRSVNYYSGWYDYKFDRKYSKLLHETIKNRSISYEESECHDLPPKVPKPVYVSFTEDMKVYYNQVISELKGSKGNLRVTRSSWLLMRQIASGFMGIHDDETGSKAEIEFPDNPKINALRQIIKEIPENRKFLIFHEYVWTGERISRELEKMGIKHGRLYGGQKDGPGVIRRFRAKGSKMRCLVVNNNSGSFSLNMQVANYLIVVESPVSPIVRGQMEKRIHRGAQKRRCFIIDIIMKKNTADESIQANLKEGKNIERLIMRGKGNIKLKKVA